MVRVGVMEGVGVRVRVWVRKGIGLGRSSKGED